MRTALAWHNLVHRKARSGAALAGVCMAIVLIFLQLGFYRAAFRSSVLALDAFRYDIAIVSPQYAVIRQPGDFPRTRLYQALAVPGVAWTSPLYAGVVRASFPGQDVRRETLVLGLRPADRPSRYLALNDLYDDLTVRDTALVDLKQGPGYQALAPGTRVELDGHAVDLVGAYHHGTGFTANAGVAVSDLTFARIFPDASLERVTFGLVSVARGADPAQVVRRLRALLPGDVRVMTRAEQERSEQRFNLDVKPVGIMFTSGLLLAFIVGAVILYQILVSEIIHHLREFATLKAMGYGRLHIRLVVWQQALLFATLGFAPALLLSTGIYWIIDRTTTLPTRMSVHEILTVFLLTSAMCLLSAMLAVRRVDRADPADLF